MSNVPINFLKIFQNFWLLSIFGERYFDYDEWQVENWDDWDNLDLKNG